MKVVVVGASGFIGARLCTALLERGHDVLGVARTAAPRPPHPRRLWLRCDVTRMGVADWLDALGGAAVVVNCVGILRQTRRRRFGALHIDAARVLGAACLRARVRRVVQISALGADAAAETAYHRSKHAADQALLALPLDAVVVQPSLVFGAGGASATLFLRLAALPWLPLPAGGTQRLQPVHVDDVVDALVALVADPDDGRGGQRIAFVGPTPLTWAQYLQALRAALGLPPARGLTIPAWLMTAAARAGDSLGGTLFDSAAWRMLERGNTASADAMTALLQRAPRAAAQFVPHDAAPWWRVAAQLPPWLLLLRLAVAALWLATAAVSFGVYPLAESHALLARSGVPAALQPAALYAAAALNLLLGVLTLALPARRRAPLWAAQVLVIVVYTSIISVRLPEFWIHPYGPLTKNLPLLAAIGMLWALERPSRRR